MSVEDKTHTRRRKRRSRTSIISEQAAPLAPVNAGAPDHVTSTLEGGKNKRRRPKDDTHDVDSERKRARFEVGDLRFSNFEEQKPGTLIKTRSRESKTKSRKHSKALTHANRSHAWVVSGKVGGRFLPIDPVYSADEKYFLLATAHCLHIYITRSSQLYRKVDLASYGDILCLAAGSKSEGFVGTSKGHVVHVDWQTGEILGSKRLAASVDSISYTRTSGSSTSSTAKAETDLLDIICEEKDSSSLGARRICRVVWRDSDSKPVELLQSPEESKEIQSLDDGKVVIAVAAKQVFIGLANDGVSSSTEQSLFTWYTIATTDEIVSFEARSTAEEPASKQKRASQKKESRTQILDLALGTMRGTILIYEDVLQKLVGMESTHDRQQSAVRSSLSPRVLHWHRTAVNSVKWARDGNYLISGGNETVLIIWQLRTGKKQELPHLAAAIDCLVVSPSGTSYALLLADSSMMILSTAELQPIAHVSGIQTLAYRSDDSESVHNGSLQSAQGTMRNTSAAVLHPLRPNIALLAIPRSRSKTENIDTLRGKPFLLTFDVATSTAISRQALTRNFTTDLSIGPEGQRLVEPEVTFLKLSHDGKWLATVEEWYTATNPERTKAAVVSGASQKGRLEVYLKFWQWDKEDENWVLQARIDSPHTLEDDFTPANVFGLEAHPNRHEFATASADGLVRVWHAKTRLRNGIVVKGPADEGLVTWVQKHATELDGPVTGLEESDTPRPTPTVARLAYSEDGSVIVAAHAHAHADYDGCGVVRFIDTSTGKVVQSRSDLFCSGLVDVALLGRHLVVLSDALVVWDLVDDVLEFGYNITDKAGPTQVALRKLAVNHESGTLAIALPASKKRSGYRVIIFNPRSSEPVFVSSNLANVTNLLAVPGSARYLLINDGAEVYTISQRETLQQPLIDNAVAQGEAAMPPVPEDEVTSLVPANGAMDLDSHDMESDLEMESVPAHVGEREDEDKEDGIEFNKVSRQLRADLFVKYTTAALPGRHEMFSDIWNLYVPKSKNVQPMRKMVES